MSLSIRERGISYCVIRFPYRPKKFFNDDFKLSLTYPCSRILFESRLKECIIIVVAGSDVFVLSLIVHNRMLEEFTVHNIVLVK